MRTYDHVVQLLRIVVAAMEQPTPDLAKLVSKGIVPPISTAFGQKLNQLLDDMRQQLQDAMGDADGSEVYAAMEPWVAMQVTNIARDINRNSGEPRRMKNWPEELAEQAWGELWSAEKLSEYADVEDLAQIILEWSRGVSHTNQIKPSTLPEILVQQLREWQKHHQDWSRRRQLVNEYGWQNLEKVLDFGNLAWYRIHNEHDVELTGEVMNNCTYRHYRNDIYTGRMLCYLLMGNDQIPQVEVAYMYRSNNKLLLDDARGYRNSLPAQRYHKHIRDLTLWLERELGTAIYCRTTEYDEDLDDEDLVRRYLGNLLWGYRDKVRSDYGCIVPFDLRRVHLMDIAVGVVFVYAEKGVQAAREGYEAALKATRLAGQVRRLYGLIRKECQKDESEADTIFNNFFNPYQGEGKHIYSRLRGTSPALPPDRYYEAAMRFLGPYNVRQPQ